ncbi:D1-like (plasmid) [Dictyostelium discoideum]|uniref:D1-like n=1 Tax=Dictyostelium discoideum TaxID=44689 RepID=O60985_DICDI|nr:D1-like [Dictyostelium discoideum]AAC14392.1 D1-like [Dictyostelium discoideum]|eukprot:NP_046745.1 D1-like (plasmid) [Dictyostelium discoideum]
MPKSETNSIILVQPPTTFFSDHDFKIISRKNLKNLVDCFILDDKLVIKDGSDNKIIPESLDELYKLLCQIHTSKPIHLKYTDMVKQFKMLYHVSNIENSILSFLRCCEDASCKHYCLTLKPMIKNEKNNQLAIVSPKSKSKSQKIFATQNTIVDYDSDCNQVRIIRSYRDFSFLTPSPFFYNLYIQHLYTSYKKDPNFPRLISIDEFTAISLLYNQNNQSTAILDNLKNNSLTNEAIDFIMYKTMLQFSPISRKKNKFFKCLSTNSYPEIFYFFNLKSIFLDGNKSKRIFTNADGSLNELIIFPIAYGGHISLGALYMEKVEEKIRIQYMMHVDKFVKSTHCCIDVPSHTCKESDCYSLTCTYQKFVCWKKIKKAFIIQLMVENNENLTFLDTNDDSLIFENDFPVLPFSFGVNETIDCHLAFVRNLNLVVDCFYVEIPKLSMESILKSRFSTHSTQYTLDTSHFQQLELEISNSCKQFAMVQEMVEKEITPSGFAYDLKCLNPSVGFPPNIIFEFAIQTSFFGQVKQYFSYISTYCVMMSINKGFPSGSYNFTKIELNMSSLLEDVVFFYYYSTNNMLYYTTLKNSATIGNFHPSTSFKIYPEVSFFFVPNRSIPINYDQDHPSTFFKKIIDSYLKNVQKNEDHDNDIQPIFSTKILVLKSKKSDSLLSIPLDNNNLDLYNYEVFYKKDYKELEANEFYYHTNIKLQYKQINYIINKIRENHSINNAEKSSKSPSSPFMDCETKNKEYNTSSVNEPSLNQNQSHFQNQNQKKNEEINNIKNESDNSLKRRKCEYFDQNAQEKAETDINNLLDKLNLLTDENLKIQIINNDLKNENKLKDERIKMLLSKGSPKDHCDNILSTTLNSLKVQNEEKEAKINLLEKQVRHLNNVVSENANFLSQINNSIGNNFFENFVTMDILILILENCSKSIEFNTKKLEEYIEDKILLKNSINSVEYINLTKGSLQMFKNYLIEILSKDLGKVPQIYLNELLTKFSISEAQINPLIPDSHHIKHNIVNPISPYLNNFSTFPDNFIHFILYVEIEEEKRLQLSSIDISFMFNEFLEKLSKCQEITEVFKKIRDISKNSLDYVQKNKDKFLDVSSDALKRFLKKDELMLVSNENGKNIELDILNNIINRCNYCILFADLAVLKPKLVLFQEATCTVCYRPCIGNNVFLKCEKNYCNNVICSNCFKENIKNCSDEYSMSKRCNHCISRSISGKLCISCEKLNSISDKLEICDQIVFNDVDQPCVFKLCKDCKTKKLCPYVKHENVLN